MGPRLRVADRSGEVTHVWEGAVAIRRDVFTAVDGWPGEFRFVHEGVDLGWRVMDAATGSSMPATSPHRTAVPTTRNGWDYFGARNRVWLARRHLAWPLAVPFVTSFALRTVPRLDSPEKRRAALRGYRDGITQPCGPRRPLRRATVGRMARLGRPRCSSPRCTLPPVADAAIPIIGYGAGGHARSLLEAIASRGRYEVVALVDDDPALEGTTVLGVPVWLGSQALGSLHERSRACVRRRRRRPLAGRPRAGVRTSSRRASRSPGSSMPRR